MKVGSGREVGGGKEAPGEAATGKDLRRSKKRKATADEGPSSFGKNNPSILYN